MNVVNVYQVKIGKIVESKFNCFHEFFLRVNQEEKENTSLEIKTKMEVRYKGFEACVEKIPDWFYYAHDEFDDYN